LFVGLVALIRYLKLVLLAAAIGFAPHAFALPGVTLGCPDATTDQYDALYVNCTFDNESGETLLWLDPASSSFTFDAPQLLSGDAFYAIFKVFWGFDIGTCGVLTPPLDENLPTGTICHVALTIYPQLPIEPPPPPGFGEWLLNLYMTLTEPGGDYVKLSASPTITIYGRGYALPEPTTLALLGVGIAAVGFARRR
jgi:hypothetical protein